MQIYSKDLRIRAVAAVERGIPRREVVETFSISLTTLKRWLRMSRAGKDLTPRFSTGRKRRILATLEEKRLLWSQLLEENDDATLKRHCEMWEERTGVRVSISAMSRAIRNKLGWTYKKRRWVPPGCHRGKRRSEKCFQGAPERGRPEALGVLFVDESSTNVALSPRATPGRPRQRGLTVRRLGTGARRTSH
jgi:transposase